MYVSMMSVSVLGYVSQLKSAYVCSPRSLNKQAYLILVQTAVISWLADEGIIGCRRGWWWYDGDDSLLGTPHTP